MQTCCVASGLAQCSRMRTWFSLFLLVSLTAVDLTQGILDRHIPQTAKFHSSSSLTGKPDLEVALSEQLHSLNQVFSRGNVKDLLRFFTPDVRVDVPGRPGVHGHGAELVFALQMLFAEKGHRRVIVEEAIQLREVRVKGKNDKERAWFVLTRNGFPLIDTKGSTLAAKAVILWELVYGLRQNESDTDPRGASGRGFDHGLEQTANEPGFEPNDPKPRLMIRWLIWNDDDDSAAVKLSTTTGGAEGKGEPGLERWGLLKTGLQKTSSGKVGLQKAGVEKEGLLKTGLLKTGLEKGLQTAGAEQSGQAGNESNDVSIKSVYCTLQDRWDTFNRVLNREDFSGCMDFTAPDTVVMPPGSAPLLGADLELLCDAFVQEGVTQDVVINVALLLKGRRTARGPRGLSSSEATYFVLENDAFTNSYTQSNDTDSGKQVILWEVQPKGSVENGSPLKKGTLRWAWTIWNGNAPRGANET